MDANVNSEDKIQICMKDFHVALSKVFPSVSKKDEQAYARLETNLRKTRSHIESEPTEAAAKPALGLNKPTPSKK